MDYDFEAPTYVNFAENMDEDEAEVSKYFDVEHEESFHRVQGTPKLILPEGPRDLPSAKKDKEHFAATPSSPTPCRKRSCSSSFKTSLQSSSSANKKTPARLKTPMKSKKAIRLKTPGNLKLLSKSKNLSQTPQHVLEALLDLQLTPAAPASPTSMKLKRSRVDDSQLLSSCKYPCHQTLLSPITIPETVKVSSSAPDIEQLILESCSKKYRKCMKVGGTPSVADGIVISLPSDKKHCMETRADAASRHPPIQLRSRAIRKSQSGRHLMEINSELCSSKRRSLSSNIKSCESAEFSAKLCKPAAERFVSLAEATKQFHNRTPLRFRARLKNSPGVKCKGPIMCLKATIPQSPALRVKHRNRPTTAISREEREELELVEIQKNQVKPLPLPERILKPLNPGLKFIKKPPTLPEPFKITEFKKKEPLLEPEPVKFTAKPIPKKILEGPVGIGPKKPVTVTETRSPSFVANALKRSRAAKQQRTPLKATQKFSMKVVQGSHGLQIVNDGPLGHLGVPFPSQPSKNSTEIKPFSFEERDKEWLRRKEEKLKELEEQMIPKTVFHAKPVPSRRSGTPVIRARTPGSHQKRASTPQSVPDAKRALSPLFKARPPTVLMKKPFEPVKPNRQLPLPNVTLASEMRAKDRELFDQEQLKRELEMEALKQQMQAERERKEQEEVYALRKQAVHKSIPVPKVKPFEPQPSNKSLTNPSTPFCLKRSSKRSVV